MTFDLRKRLICFLAVCVAVIGVTLLVDMPLVVAFVFGGALGVAGSVVAAAWERSA